MCELFALSASAPVDVKVSLSELARHGGETAHHSDGWGVAFADGRDFRLFKDAEAAATSPWIRCLADHPIRSKTVVAHIRHATRGARTAENTQPFAREFGGIVRVFAHNGDLGPFEPDANARFHAIGDTDSEAAFCALLQEAAPGPMPLETFRRFAERARALGPANFIYAEPNRLLVHADRRKQADGSPVPPGLWILCRHCAPGPVEGSPVAISAAAETKVVLVASVPLSGEKWRPLKRGIVLEIANGEILTP